MEEYYPELVERFGNRDFLHSAYITVYETPCPVGSRRDTFGHRIGNQYFRNKRKEFSRAMRFIVPDPLFWLFQAEQPEEEPQPEKDEPTVEEKEKEERNVKSFLRTRFSNEEMIIYSLAMDKNYDEHEISEITGWSVGKVNDLLGRMLEAVVNDYCKPEKKRKSGEGNKE
jgi:DNA-directed RNA polymerase specialized sigma24 family protein